MIVKFLSIQSKNSKDRIRCYPGSLEDAGCRSPGRRKGARFIRQVTEGVLREAKAWVALPAGFFLGSKKDSKRVKDKDTVHKGEATEEKALQ